MSFDLTKIFKLKLFPTKEERAARVQQEHERDTQYGDPKYELRTIYLACKYGIMPASAITALSTTYFVFAAMYSHVVELAADSFWLQILLTVLLGVVAILFSGVVEWALQGVWKPFYKQAFISKWKEVDGVLLTCGILFSGIVVGFAFWGMMMLSESTPTVSSESAVGTNNAANALIAAKDKEIAGIKQCKTKGGYCWNGNLTAKGIKAVEALQAEKAQILANAGSTIAVTGKNNETKILDRNTRVARAQKYLGRLGLLTEAIKAIFFALMGVQKCEVK